MLFNCTSHSTPAPASANLFAVSSPQGAHTPLHDRLTDVAHVTAISSTTVVQKADLKRAFAPDLVPNSSFPSKRFEHAFTHHPIHSPELKGPSMVQASSRTFMPIPSFMSVFGEQANTTLPSELSQRDGTSHHGNQIIRPASSGNTIGGPSSATVPFAAFHIHRDSTSTIASNSSDSSPTTTISTMDSSSVTDPSPGPSPESPIARITPSSFVPDFRSRRTESNSLDNSPAAFFELARPTTPAKKPRNLKNLGINTTSSLGNLRSTPMAPLPGLVKREKNTSAPTSPSFIKPPTPPKRRPSNLSLTIKTPGSNENKGPMRLMIPSTPALHRPALRHFQSSPSLPLCSPMGPPGGMQFPALRPIKTNPHGLSEVPFEMEEEDQEQNFDVPQSREEKPAAYPNGPICIYESGVFLYFEPTVEQAVTYDVIINVASEVMNPFTTAASVSRKELDARRVDGPPAENVDFASLPERTKPSSFDTQDSSPTTPKATPTLETVSQTAIALNGTHSKTPEYIHMQWEHNTDIVPDLYKLVKLMDDRVQQGKRILVHCQCGVSRSASLIVAYGIYKNPGISVQEAYDSVKKRSKWIGPNMNLIMQLQEFRNGLIKLNETRSFHGQGFGMSSQRRSAGISMSTTNSTGTNKHSQFDRDMSFVSRTPQTAPLPPDNDLNLQRASTGNMMAISPGPTSAPQRSFFSAEFRRSWASSRTHFDLSPKASPKAIPYVDPTGHVIPVLSITNNDRSAGQADVEAREDPAQSEQEAGLRPFSVPNFSRQFPLRTNTDSEDATHDTQPAAFLMAPKGFGSFDTLRSPAVPSFNLSALSSNSSTDSQVLSPRTSEFDITPWPRGYDTDSQHSPAISQHSPISPRSAGPSLHELDLTSPIKTESPKDTFAPSADALDQVTSPRATEFHMTPLKPRVADTDPFGLTSPREFDFPSNPFESLSLARVRNIDPEPRRPSFQAFLPPSHLAQPQAINGFTSLNGTALPQPTVSLPGPFPSLQLSKAPETEGRIDSLATSLESREAVPKPLTAARPSPKIPHVNIAKSPQHMFLSTPPRSAGIRTRFSSPNMREHRRLQRLQTEMEAKIPHRLPQPTQSTDDLDALMSPRAEEFTRNPFHMDFFPAEIDVSPASSNETITDNDNRNDRKDPHQWTPQKSVEDPRSPVQTGSNPIVRNIWDVL
ncbi:hypothetical protein K504DRAFT_527097 [Pleomassaria siparia CBS 279.74]|uniref:protein-tyrosine-phosphatase n=1 Tax=Pleomassaria siparia CBS 279.74 TaxID=1314801 RepID=A0A6G1K803_9PLEO|nr:hypothetical protein K504DRAFT_527097 [Pleomassaria siparia CBS 279.74]